MVSHASFFFKELSFSYVKNAIGFYSLTQGLTAKPWLYWHDPETQWGPTCLCYHICCHWNSNGSFTKSVGDFLVAWPFFTVLILLTQDLGASTSSGVPFNFLSGPWSCHLINLSSMVEFIPGTFTGRRGMMRWLSSFLRQPVIGYRYVWKMLSFVCWFCILPLYWKWLLNLSIFWWNCRVS